VQHLRRAYQAGRGDYEQVLGQNVERILAEIDRLDEIARAFSRYGTVPDERRAGEPIDVAAVVRDVVELERLGAADSPVAWRLDGAEPPRVALARDDELREVLLNVLENARLAGAREVRVAVAGGEPGDGAVHVTVQDDGAGIPPALLSRVFEPHFSTRTSGSGLGLAISRRLVEGWGGTITLQSAEGAGTEVRITLAAVPR
jgi:signal transduction histidine kinase